MSLHKSKGAKRSVIEVKQFPVSGFPNVETRKTINRFLEEDRQFWKAQGKIVRVQKGDVKVASASGGGRVVQYAIIELQRSF
jgi:hypothetical protein